MGYFNNKMPRLQFLLLRIAFSFFFSLFSGFSFSVDTKRSTVPPRPSYISIVDLCTPVSRRQLLAAAVPVLHKLYYYYYYLFRMNSGCPFYLILFSLAKNAFISLSLGSPPLRESQSRHRLYLSTPGRNYCCSLQLVPRVC